MVLAEGEHFDVLDQNELVGVLAKDGVLDGILNRVLITLRHNHNYYRDAISLDQARPNYCVSKVSQLYNLITS